MLFYIPQTTPVMTAARRELLRLGCPATKHPSKAVTHLLLNVPTTVTQEELTQITEPLPADVTILGGNLGGKGMDLLTDAQYQAENAAITAHCALKILLTHMPMTLQDCPVLIIGWGRIGKCMGKLLRDLGAKVTISSRSPNDRGMITALGYPCADTAALEPVLGFFRVIINTAPAPVISPEQADLCRTDCIKLDLASQQGIAGEDVIWARGLPGKEAPETSGKLIARTALRLTKERSKL